MRFAVVLCILTRVAVAAPAEPSGPHPRMLLDEKLREAWRAQVKSGRGPAVGAIAVCDEARTTKEHDRALYQGAEWAKTLQACLVAWATTEKPEHAATALRFFTALLDDLDVIGDGKGGDAAARRDDGYAIRNLGPYTALAYDWLHDQPGMTPQLRERARKRWEAWLGWYREKGYRARAPGTNYHAGYLLAATLIAVAWGGEAAEERGPELWKLVADELWGKDMAAALATGGILDGGDWPEGWQYGPLAVASYALAARVAVAAGIRVDGVAPWLASVLRRHVYALTPSGHVWAGGDTESEAPHVDPHVLTLDAISLGDASPDDKRWAKGELSRLQLVDRDYLLYDALATAGEPPQLVPRAKWPSWYLAANTATLFARTRWDERAVWFVAECAPALKGLDGERIDHRHPNAGNFVLSRGIDDAIVDPTPYGALSTLPSNSPTVASGRLPAKYAPSQGLWSEKIAWTWATQTRGGVVAARCEYADAYRFQDRSSDIAEAVRDFVVLPSADGTDVAVVVIDRARGSDRMHLRFHSPIALALAGTNATATIGATKLAILGVATGAPAIGRAADKDCFKNEEQRGRCDASRFPTTDYRVEIAGPAPRAVHVIGASAAGNVTAAQQGDRGVRVAGPRDAIVVWGDGEYRAPKGKAVTHVALDGGSLAARADGDACVVTVQPGGDKPAIATIDEACKVTVDPAAPSAASAISGKPAPVPGKSKRRAGCCAAEASPGASLGMTLVVGVVLARRRRGRRTAR